MTESQELVRREPTDALSQIMGTGNTKAMLAQVEENVRAVIDVARARGFVRRYNDGGQEFFGEPAWALLSMTYGLVPFVEWTKPVQNGWEARAVVRTRDGDEVGAAEAMCTRNEANRKNANDHTLRAMAQTRARRNAMRSCLGAALVLSGFDFADPDGPATKAQVGVLHQLERELGWSHDEGHARAGIDSFKELTRELAAELIDEWTAERDGRPAEQGNPNPRTSPLGDEPAPPVPSSGPPPTASAKGKEDATGKAPAGGVSSSSDGPGPSGGGDEGMGKAPESSSPAEPWDTYLRARADAEWKHGTPHTDRLVRDWWRERKTGPPKPDWSAERLAELTEFLDAAAAQETLEGGS